MSRILNFNEDAEHLSEILIGRGFVRQTALAYEEAVNTIKSNIK